MPSDKERQAIIGMIEVWNIFDAVYISNTKAEVILKLIRSIQFKEPRREGLYNTINNKMRSGQTYGEELCKLMSYGDFE